MLDEVRRDAEILAHNIAGEKAYIRQAERNHYRNWEKAHIHEINGDHEKAAESWKLVQKWDDEVKARREAAIRRFGRDYI